mmetsp:Transcript_38256/g.65318  ORF Transcript_38256/g.65318 Transcript_38256/m.65318 type:complete len:102 (-) Transcript_38256:853-1158(-)
MLISLSHYHLSIEAMLISSEQTANRNTMHCYDIALIGGQCVSLHSGESNVPASTSQTEPNLTPLTNIVVLSVPHCEMMTSTPVFTIETAASNFAFNPPVTS